MRKINKNNTSGFPGVHWREDKCKWQAKIGVNRRRIHLGYFDSAEKAYHAYKRAKLNYLTEDK